MLAPGEQRHYQLEFGIVTSTEALAELEKQAQRAAAAKPVG
jgi:hypothetical protein